MPDDTKALRQLLREAVRALRMPSRELERELGLGNGNLSHLLDGTLEIRVRHLLSFSRLMRVPVAEFLEMGCPESARYASRHLSDWLGRGREAEAPSASAASAAAPADLPADLTALVRSVVREELARLAEAAKVDAAAPGA